MVYIPEKLTGEMRFAIGIRQTLLKKVMVKKTKAKDKDKQHVWGTQVPRTELHICNSECLTPSSPCVPRTGAKNMTDSAAYPRLFGSRIASLHMEWKDGGPFEFIFT